MVSDKASACPNCGAPVEKKLLCEDCGNVIPPGVTACPSCGCPIGPTMTSSNEQNLSDNSQRPYDGNYEYDFNPDEESNDRKRYWIWALAGLLVAAVAGVLYYLSETGVFRSNNETLPEDSTAVEEQVITEEDEQQAILDGITTWFYGQMEDDLTHEVTAYTATIESKNECQFDSYGNKARLIMQLVYSSLYLSQPSTTVLFSFDDGKTNLCRYAENFSSGIRVVFDDGEVDTRWSLIDSSPKRNSIYMYMPSKVKPFLAELRSSKTCRIQVNLEHVGMTTFDFNIEGLRWDYDKDNSTVAAEKPSVEMKDAAADDLKEPVDAVADQPYEAAAD